MNTTKLIKTLILQPGIYALFFLAISGCKISGGESAEIKVPELKIETFPTENGWGYNILSGEKIMIKQETIPAVPGNEAFKTSDEAEKVASVVVKKINRGELPSLTPAEIDSLLFR